jgi:hypothetical protein
MKKTGRVVVASLIALLMVLGGLSAASHIIGMPRSPSSMTGWPESGRKLIAVPVGRPAVNQSHGKTSFRRP